MVSANSSPARSVGSSLTQDTALSSSPGKLSTKFLSTEAGGAVLSTAVYVKDAELGWRPAELLSKGIASAIDEGNTDNVKSSPSKPVTLKGRSGSRSPGSRTRPGLSRPNSEKSTASSAANGDTASVMLTPLPWHQPQTEVDLFTSTRQIGLKPKPKTSGKASPTSIASTGELNDETGSADTRKSTPLSNVEDQSAQREITNVDLTEYENKALPLQDLDDNGELVIRGDLCNMPYLHEASILYNLRGRHEESRPYTRAGVVIAAVNPLQWIPNLYSPSVRRTYAEELVWRPSRGLDFIEPHVYEASALAYRGLILNGQNQSILVSGETGAGKTETVKILMSHLATMENTRYYVPPPEDEQSDEASEDLGDRLARESSFSSALSGNKKKRRRGKLMFAMASSRLLRRVSHSISRSLHGACSSANSVDIDVTCRSAESSPEQATSSLDLGAPVSVLPTVPDDETSVAASSVATTTTAYDDPANNAIIQKVLDANPLLEAFGNAKTTRNDNSSRFSKYNRLQFHVEHGQNGAAAPACTLAGSVCDTYLLEKSRVVGHESQLGERTFHIFYQLLASSAEDKSIIWDMGLNGTTAESFKYVGHSATNSIEGVPDAHRWDEVVSALQNVGVKEQKFLTFFRAMCVVLQLGNLTFAADEEKIGLDGSKVSSWHELGLLSDIIGVPSEELATALTTRTVKVGQDVFKKPLTPSAAKDGCDAFAKAIYAALFDWLVAKINDATRAELNYERREEVVDNKFHVIGLLDIFGFETFEVNRFEQLCINHANEKLQERFIEDVFKSVQVECQSEGIELTDSLTFPDNQNVLELVEGKVGLIDLLNEECIRPKGSDSGFVNKLYATARKSAPLSSSPRKAAAVTGSKVLFSKRNFSRTEFGVHHYAGPVVYDATNFVTKNNDTLPVDIMKCALNSTNHLIKDEFAAKADSCDDAKKGSLVADTVWTKFRMQLNSLMEELDQTRTRYVRCIVPNRKKAPGEMDMMFTLKQLRCAGIVHAVTLSRAFFPNKMLLATVLERFAVLIPIKAPALHHQLQKKKQQQQLEEREEKEVGEQAPQRATTLRDDVSRLLEALLVEKNTDGKEGNQDVSIAEETERCEASSQDSSEKIEEKEEGNYGSSKENRSPFVCGRTKVYFRAGVLEKLEADRLQAFETMATKIQSIFRRNVVRERYGKLLAERRAKGSVTSEEVTAVMTTKRKKPRMSARIKRKMLLVASAARSSRADMLSSQMRRRTNRRLLMAE